MKIQRSLFLSVISYVSITFGLILFVWGIDLPSRLHILVGGILALSGTILWLYLLQQPLTFDNYPIPHEPKATVEVPIPQIAGNASSNEQATLSMAKDRQGGDRVENHDVTSNKFNTSPSKTPGISNSNHLFGRKEGPGEHHPNVLPSFDTHHSPGYTNIYKV